MNNTIKTLLGLVLLFVPMKIGALSDGVREIVLQTETPAGTGFRSPSIIEVECFLWEEPGVLFISSSEVTENVIIELQNTTSGDAYYGCCTLMPAPFLLYLFGPGCYDISLTLPSGAVYSASFIR